MHLSRRTTTLTFPAIIQYEHTKPPVPRGGCFGRVLVEGPGINVSVESRGT